MSEKFEITDKIKMSDFISKNDKRRFRPMGVVNVFSEEKNNSEKKLIANHNNLIVYRARANAIARMFNIDPADTGSAVGIKDQYVKWFGVGSGGTASTATNQVPLVVNPTDYKLRTHLNITGGNSGNYYTCQTNSNITYKKFDTGFPTIFVDEDIPPVILESTPYSDTTSKFNNEFRDSLLVVKIQLSLDYNEANGTIPAIGQPISELGLFFSNRLSSEAITGTELDLFARFTMPTVMKHENRRLSFDWFVYF